MKEVYYTCDVCGKRLGKKNFYFKAHRLKEVNTEWVPHVTITTKWVMCEDCWDKFMRFIEENKK